MAAAAYCASASTACSGFQPTAIPRSFFSLRAAATAAAGGVDVHPADDDDVAADVVDVDRRSSPERENAADGTSSLLSSEAPRSLGPKRTFLGLRRESGAVRRMLEQQRQTTSPSSSSALSSSATALMPDGGLSPCVIKVLGVGGGGSNAVRRRLSSNFFGGVILLSAPERIPN